MTIIVTKMNGEVTSQTQKIKKKDYVASKTLSYKTSSQMKTQKETLLKYRSSKLDLQVETEIAKPIQNQSYTPLQIHLFVRNKILKKK